MNLTDTDATYFLCPDMSCGLFYNPDCHVPCDQGCPHHAQKAIVCHNCKSTIILPFTHFSCCRVDCVCGAANFQRMSGIYRRYDMS
jgi:hypothetical protein